MGEAKTHTVLVVDDEPDLTELMCRVLVRQGYTVLVACGVTDGLRMLGEHADPIELLLTDVRMPDGNVGDLVDAARTIHPKIKVVYISGLPEYHPGIAEIADADPVVVAKPFTTTALATAVRTVLNAGPAQRPDPTEAA